MQGSLTSGAARTSWGASDDDWGDVPTDRVEDYLARVEARSSGWTTTRQLVYPRRRVGDRAPRAGVSSGTASKHRRHGVVIWHLGAPRPATARACLQPPMPLGGGTRRAPPILVGDHGWVDVLGAPSMPANESPLPALGLRWGCHGGSAAPRHGDGVKRSPDAPAAHLALPRGTAGCMFCIAIRAPIRARAALHWRMLRGGLAVDQHRATRALAGRCGGDVAKLTSIASRRHRQQASNIHGMRTRASRVKTRFQSCRQRHVVGRAAHARCAPVSCLERPPRRPPAPPMYRLPAVSPLCRLARRAQAPPGTNRRLVSLAVVPLACL